MAIDKRGKGTYRIRIDIGRDESGKRMVHHETLEGTKENAKAREAALKLLFKTGRAVKNVKQTLNDFFVRDWFPTAAGKRRIRTMEEYRKLFERHIRPELGMERLDRLHPIAIQRFYNKLTERGLSPRSVRNAHAVLHQALAYAVKMQLIAFNPASGVELPAHQDRNTMRSFDPDQAQAFLQASRSHRIGIVFRFALETGTRPQEYCAVEWPDLNLETGAVSINKAMIWPSGAG